MNSTELTSISERSRQKNIENQSKIIEIRLEVAKMNKSNRIWFKPVWTEGFRISNPGAATRWRPVTSSFSLLTTSSSRTASLGSRLGVTCHSQEGGSVFAVATQWFSSKWCRSKRASTARLQGFANRGLVKLVMGVVSTTTYNG